MPSPSLDHINEIKENLEATKKRLLDVPDNYRNLFQVYTIEEIKQLARARMDPNDTPEQHKLHVQACNCMSLLEHYLQGAGQFAIKAKDRNDTLGMSAMFGLRWAAHLCILMDEHIRALENLLETVEDDAQFREKVSNLARISLRAGGLQTKYDPTGALAIREEVLLATSWFERAYVDHYTSKKGT